MPVCFHGSRSSDRVVTAVAAAALTLGAACGPATDTERESIGSTRPEATVEAPAAPDTDVDAVAAALADGTPLSADEQAALGTYRRFLALRVEDADPAEKDRVARSSARALLDQPPPFDGPIISPPRVTTGIRSIATTPDGSVTIDDCATYDYGVEITADTHHGETTPTIRDWVHQEVGLEPVDDSWVVTSVDVRSSSQRDGEFCVPPVDEAAILDAWGRFVEGFFASTEDPTAPLPSGVTAAALGLQDDVARQRQRLVDTGQHIPAAPVQRDPRITYHVPANSARVVDCVTWPQGREIWTASEPSGVVASPGQVEPISGRIRFGDDGPYVETLDPVSPAECAEQPA